jgi:non-heme Fe2+,alpha-ketoglutarate-dependent halogenase
MIQPTPVRRPLWIRTLLVAGLAFLAVWKALQLPRRKWPQPMRGILQNWTWGMFRVVMGSWITRAYIDQPCTLRTPQPLIPKASADLRYALSPSDLQFFYDNGYLGPYPAFSSGQIEQLARSLMLRRTQPSYLYGFPTDRDLHFEDDLLLEFLAEPAILERAAQLLGPDLACWRSQVFLKPPGGSAIQWHQASTYMMEDYLEPALHPPDRNELFQLTIWIALDDATRENGCMQAYPGSHKEIRTIRFGGNEGFYKVNFTLEFESRPEDAVSLEVPAGHFILFSERVIHGSGPNTSTKRRMAVNFRLIPPNVRVYPDQRTHRAMHMGQVYSLDRWSLLLLRGEDRYELNKTKRLHRQPVTEVQGEPTALVS